MAHAKKFGSRTDSDHVLDGIDLTGKKIVVTGANTGIGYETARSLAAAGAEVVVACRSEDKGKSAVDAIRKCHNDVSVEFKKLDLSSIESV